MVNIHLIFGIIAGAISFVAYIYYCQSIIWGPTKPNKATWWILTISGAVTAASYYSGGARDTMLLALVYVLGPLMLAILSLKYGEGKWTSLETKCLLGAILSLELWFIFKSPLLGLLTNLLIDFIGLVPTIVKSYVHPKGEDKGPWTLEFISNIINLFAIERWIFAIWIYPVYLVIINGSIAFLLFSRSKSVAKQNPR